MHSWNGKYRRPEDLLSPDYHQPMKDDLLWVYEGLTEYLGEVLTSRSGFWTLDQSREALAHLAATYDSRPGRDWRPLQDTADSGEFIYDAGWTGQLAPRYGFLRGGRTALARCGRNFAPGQRR